jgi:hypothetical protein
MVTRLQFGYSLVTVFFNKIKEGSKKEKTGKGIKKPVPDILTRGKS